MVHKNTTALCASKKSSLHTIKGEQTKTMYAHNSQNTHALHIGKGCLEKKLGQFISLVRDGISASKTTIYLGGLHANTTHGLPFTCNLLGTRLKLGLNILEQDPHKTP